MKLIALLLLICSASANTVPSAFPVFLKMGFSSVLDFDEAPTRVVLGDGQLFQVERLDRSLVIRSTAPYGVSNMFVYFKNEPPRMFVLTASEDAEPTYYKSFESMKPKPVENPTAQPFLHDGGSHVLKAQFDSKKDYLTVEFLLVADAKETLKPKWDWIRLTYNRAAISPDKLWAERKEVQRDSSIRVRLIFFKPNVPRSLEGVALVIPVQGHPVAIHLSLGKRFR